MIDATFVQAHRTTSSLAMEKGGRGRLIGRTKGGMNTKCLTSAPMGPNSGIC